MCWFIERVGTISDLITALVAIGALVAAVIAWLLSKRTFRYQLINELLKEYRSKEMGSSIRRLREYFKEECQSNQDALVQKYIEDYKKEQGDDSIHNNRRAVSLFFLQLSTLAKDSYIRKTAYEIWKRSDLEIIETIIAPIEMKAMRVILNRQPILDEPNYPTYMKEMLKFYRGAPVE